MWMSLSALVLLTSAFVVAQRPFFAGSRPIGFPDLPNRTTTTPDPLGNRFGEGTTERLPIEANGDRDLIDRLSKLPIDKQPFWFINWQALEAHRKNPQTYPQRPSAFAPLVPPPSNNANSQPANSNSQPASANSQPAPANSQPASANFQPATDNSLPANTNFQSASANFQPANSNSQSTTDSQTVNTGNSDPNFFASNVAVPPLNLNSNADLNGSSNSNPELGNRNGVVQNFQPSVSAHYSFRQRRNV